MSGTRLLLLLVVTAAACLSLLLLRSAVQVFLLSAFEFPEGVIQETLEEVMIRMKGPLVADDPLLVQLIKMKYLLHPSSLPYNFSLEPQHRNVYVSAILIGSIVKDFFKSKKGGFFVEAGALDGEYLSHTIKLEQELGWKGLLVEPDVQNFERLQSKNRKVWSSPTCLSLKEYAEKVIIWRAVEGQGNAKLLRGTGTVMARGEPSPPTALYNSALTEAQCVPFASLMTALNLTHVDFFVLDVEQAEENILANFPFDKITVDLWAIEHVTGYEDENFVRFMVTKGFYYFDALCYEVSDYFFVRKESELFERLQVPSYALNRTSLCHYKHYRNERNFSLALSNLRDPHHYPRLAYRDRPVIKEISEGSLYYFRLH